MIEAELKARVHSPDWVMRHLDERATARVEVYQDAYYDRPDGLLEKADQELRVRTVQGPDTTRAVLTFKAAAVDDESGSKPEHETHVENLEATHAILRGLGYVEVIAFEKYCRNYEFETRGRWMLATLVHVPEIDGTFLEVETLVDEDEVSAALDDVRNGAVQLPSALGTVLHGTDEGKPSPAADGDLSSLCTLRVPHTGPVIRQRALDALPSRTVAVRRRTPLRSAAPARGCIAQLSYSFKTVSMCWAER